MHYMGDMNIRYGGYYYNLSHIRDHGYADVLRVIPVSDAGGPDNEFWFEYLTVNVPRDLAKIQSALDCCGYKACDMGPRSRARYWHMLVDALLCYGLYDTDEIQTVRIGPKEKGREHGWEDSDIHGEVDQYRADVSLRKIAKRAARSHIGY